MRSLLVVLIVVAAVAALVFLALRSGDDPTPEGPGDLSPDIAEAPEIAETKPPETESDRPLSGMVVSPGGESVPGATVRAFALGSDLWPLDPEAPLAADGLTDDLGRFSFALIPPGCYLLEARAGQTKSVELDLER